MIYGNEDNTFESSKEDEGLIGSLNLNAVSQQIEAYFQLPSNYVFSAAKENYKQYGNDKNTDMNKVVINTDNAGTDEYSDKHEDNTDECSI